MISYVELRKTKLTYSVKYLDGYLRLGRTLWVLVMVCFLGLHCYIYVWKLIKLLQEGGPLPGPESGLLSYTQKWIVWGDTCADKARDFIGKGHQGGEQKVRESRRTALPCGLQFGFYGDGISFPVVFSQSFWLRVLPGGAHITQPRWIPARRILGGGRIRGVSFWPFLNSSSWWWLISSMFLTRTSCCKTTHANG